MVKLDFKKTLKELYDAPSQAVVLVSVPKLQYLMLAGVGDPNTAPQYQAAVEALYSVAYNLKFMLKNEIDYVVPPLEGLWESDDMDDKANWPWTMLIMQPEAVTPGYFQQALEQVAKKKSLHNLDQMCLEALDEGTAAQITHRDPYAAEGPTVAALHQFITANGYKLTGKHHEIYLSDARKTSPEKMKTIIRQPVQK